MSDNARRLRIASAAIALAVLGLLTAAVGWPLYVRAQTVPLHPRPETVPSIVNSAPSPRWSEAVSRAQGIARRELAGQSLPGLSVAVGVAGELVWAEGFGWADLKTKAPVTPDTVFRIGTASRLLTSAGVGVLLEKDRLKLNEAIQTYVPQFPEKPWPITLGQVMGDVAGLDTDIGDDDTLSLPRCERPADAVPYFADTDLLSEPGTQDRASNYGWVLTSAAVEAGAGEPFLKFMREQIFQPLKMERTGAESSKEENPEHLGEPSEDAPFLTFFREVVLRPMGLGGPETKFPTANMATSYAPRTDDNPRLGRKTLRLRNFSCYAGSMAFYSTPSDLVRFASALQNGGLRTETVNTLQASTRLASGRTTTHGLGWKTDAVKRAGRDTQTVGQDGDLYGGRVMTLIALPESGVVVVVMSNITHTETSALALKVAESFAGSAATAR